jgi:hypothetical protein
MPSYHISSSGKLVQCKNDPCKLHAGTDFQAENRTQAKQIAQNIIANNYKNNDISLNKNDETKKLKEEAQKSQADTNNNLVIVEDRLTFRSDEFVKKLEDEIKSDKKYIELSAKMEEIEAKKKDLIKKHKEIISLIHQMNDELGELDCKRYWRKLEVGKEAGRRLEEMGMK